MTLFKKTKYVNGLEFLSIIAYNKNVLERQINGKKYFTIIRKNSRKKS